MVITVVENHQKSRIIKKPPKSTIFGIFNELLFIQNVNVARFARKIECDFSLIFKLVRDYDTSLGKLIQSL